jgi:hypothetical protein
LSTKKIRRKEERAQRVQKVDCEDGEFDDQVIEATVV